MTGDFSRSAVLIIDVWDRHWCVGASQRVAELSPRFNTTIEEMRRRGALIIHSPSSCFNYYSNNPNRTQAERDAFQNAITAWTNHPELHDRTPNPVPFKLPIDDTDGGCDDYPKCAEGSPWSRQISKIVIENVDAITADDFEVDSFQTVLALVKDRSIDTIYYCGVHVNMCITRSRPLSMINLKNEVPHLYIIRDLTDSMYNHYSAPCTNHFCSIDLVVRKIEVALGAKAVTSAEIVGDTLPFRFKEDLRRHPMITGQVVLKCWGGLGNDRYLGMSVYPHLVEDPKQATLFEVEFIGLELACFRVNQYYLDSNPSNGSIFLSDGGVDCTGIYWYLRPGWMTESNAFRLQSMDLYGDLRFLVGNPSDSSVKLIALSAYESGTQWTAESSN